MAAWEIPGDVRSVEATVDLSGSFLRFVKLSGAVVVAVAAATDKAYGVLQNKPNKASGNVFVGTEKSTAAVMVNGISRVVAGKALASGIPVYLDSVGRVTDVVQAGQCVGTTRSACSNADELVSVEIKPLGSVI